MTRAAETGTFQALYLDGKSEAAFRGLTVGDLQEGEVLVAVEYSSLNYKDGMAITGQGKVIRKFPMVPGIDLAGTVVESASPEFVAGDEVVIVGQGLGETRWGGYSQMQRVASAVLTRIPPPLDPYTAMAIGTAGYTAMLAIMALERMNVRPGGREVIVTGASGGVGSTAVILLNSLGYGVAASTGRADSHEYLRDLGARTIVDRKTLEQKTPPLSPEKWAGGIDSVGGQTLATVLAGTAAFGAVAACGLVAGTDVPATIFPFILRNVALVGISSPISPKELRLEAWERLARDMPLDKLARITHLEPMSRLPELAKEILAGRIQGRTVIKTAA